MDKLEELVQSAHKSVTLDHLVFELVFVFMLFWDYKSLLLNVKLNVLDIANRVFFLSEAQAFPYIG